MVKKKEIEISILSEILRINNQDGYNDDDDYVSRMSGIYYQCLNERKDLEWLLFKISKIKTNFFRLNGIKKREYLEQLFNHLKNKQITMPEDKKYFPITIFDIFPEISNINDSEIKNVEQSLLNVYENKIQNELRNALREKSASPIPRRGKDSPLEVADIEQFHLKINEILFSFTMVVKGFKSISRKKLRWEDVSYQISKAHNRTKPDYVILVSALEPVDSLISEMCLEGTVRGNSHLVILMLPLELAKFLRWRKII